MLKGIFAFLFCFSVQSALANTLSMDERLNDFDQLNYMIQSQYGPYKYKKEVIGLNLQALKDQYKAAIQKTTTNPEFYYLLVRYIAEFKDGHFGIKVPTDYVRAVPIMTETVDGRVLIDAVDRSKLTSTEFPFERGDEIVKVDGKPINDFVNEMKRYVSYGNESGRARIASRLVFRRPAAVVPAPIGDTITVSIRRGISSVVYDNVQLKWLDSGTPFDETKIDNFMKIKPFSLVDQTQAPSATKFSELSSRGVYELYMGKERLERSYQCSGLSRVVVPAGAVSIVTTPFVAYYHPTAKGNVGYLRIPHYDWDEQTAAVMEKYTYAISVLEKNTIGLIIDQDHNCGGSVNTVEDMVALFMDYPVDPLTFQLRASKKSYLDINEWKSETPTDTLTFQHLEKVLGLVKSSWQKGDYLTPKIGFTRETIFPAQIRYSKPVVMTIDELAGSGGDAFPSLMKGYGRATLVGQTTAGLGGHVNEMPDLNNAAMKIRMTMSLFYRPDGVAVENNGAVPDVEYVPTRDDFMNGYKNYQSFYLKVLLEQVAKRPTSKRLKPAAVKFHTPRP